VQDAKKGTAFQKKKGVNKRAVSTKTITKKGKRKQTTKRTDTRSDMRKKLTKSINKNIEQQMIEKSEIEKKGGLRVVNPNPKGPESQPSVKRKKYQKEIKKVITVTPR